MEQHLLFLSSGNYELGTHIPTTGLTSNNGIEESLAYTLY